MTTKTRMPQESRQARNSELPLLEEQARRDTKQKEKELSQDEASNSESMCTPSDTSSAKVKNTDAPTNRGSGKKWSEGRLGDRLRRMTRIE